MTEPSTATRLIAENMPQWARERVAIDAAGERVLAETVRAERDIPAFDRVTMDGIALAHAAFAKGVREFEIESTLAAGAAPPTVEDSDHCIRVMTGAVLPPGTDTVVPIERITITGARAAIEASAKVEAGQFVHRRGTDRVRDAEVLVPGMRIGPTEIAVLASAGRADVWVATLPRIAVVSTGDELVDVDEPILPHQVRSSNDRAIAAAITRHRCGDVTRKRLRDEPESLLATITALHDSHDALILSGGVSMGDFDFVPAVLERLGARLVFHRISQKPGRPMWFGVSPDAKPIFALPGNPVSTLVCLTRYILPALQRALGSLDSRLELVELAEPIDDAPSHFTYFVPVELDWSVDGVARATPRRINTSGDFSSLAGTDGIIELAPGQRTAGTIAPLYRW